MKIGKGKIKTGTRQTDRQTKRETNTDTDKWNKKCIMQLQTKQ